jgi:hypothetical protein
VTATGLIWLNTTDGSIVASDKAGGNMVTVISGSGAATHPGHLRVGGTTVYWTDTIAGTVYSAPIVKNSTATPVTSVTGARFLDVDPKDIFLSAGGGATASVQSTPLAGPTATAILPNQPNAQGVAVDLAHVFWANAGTAANAGTINRAHKDGTGVVALSMGQNFPGCIALDALSVYWINLGGGTISKTGK